MRFARCCAPTGCRFTTSRSRVRGEAPHPKRPVSRSTSTSQRSPPSRCCAARRHALSHHDAPILRRARRGAPLQPAFSPAGLQRPPCRACREIAPGELTGSAPDAYRHFVDEGFRGEAGRIRLSRAGARCAARWASSGPSRSVALPCARGEAYDSAETAPVVLFACAHELSGERSPRRRPLLRTRPEKPQAS